MQSVDLRNSLRFEVFELNKLAKDSSELSFFWATPFTLTRQTSVFLLFVFTFRVCNHILRPDLSHLLCCVFAGPDLHHLSFGSLALALHRPAPPTGQSDGAKFGREAIRFHLWVHMTLSQLLEQCPGSYCHTLSPVPHRDLPGTGSDQRGRTLHTFSYFG